MRIVFITGVLACVNGCPGTCCTDSPREHRNVGTAQTPPTPTSSVPPNADQP
jgi:hypothetical protein